MFAENLHLCAATLSATYIALAVAEHVVLRHTGHHFTPYPTIFSLWLAVPLVPVFLYSRSRHYWLRNDRIHGTQPAPVYPHRDPLLGTDWLVDMIRASKSHQLLHVWDERLRKLGGSFWHQALGGWIFLTNEPENIKAMLSTHFEEWPIGGVRQRVTTLSLGPHAIFSVNGKEWQKGRALIRPSFVRNQIADMECQGRHISRLLQRIPKDGTAVDLQELIYLFTMDSATDFMFGYSTDTLVNPTKETMEFTRAFGYTQLAASSRARLGRATYLIPDRKFSEAIATTRRFMDQYLSKAMTDQKTQERSYVFLNALVDSGETHEHIRDQLFAIIIGGRDTTASTITVLFWNLARRPDVVKRIKEEIDALEGRDPTWEDLKDMKYLAMVLKETLRLWPPVSTNLRVAAKDTILPRGGGPDGRSPVFTPKGTQCRWSTYSLQRRTDIFGEDAEEFRPERWETLRTSWEYLPFSGGPRTCLGQQFALTQMSYLVARTFQVFDAIEPADELPMLQKLSVTMSLVNGCWVKFKQPDKS